MLRLRFGALLKKLFLIMMLFNDSTPLVVLMEDSNFVHHMVHQTVDVGKKAVWTSLFMVHTDFPEHGQK